jgi:chromosome segregation ATPase
LEWSISKHLAGRSIVCRTQFSEPLCAMDAPVDHGAENHVPSGVDQGNSGGEDEAVRTHMRSDAMAQQRWVQPVSPFASSTSAVGPTGSSVSTLASTEAGRLRTQQLSMLQEQNSRLLASLETSEGELGALRAAVAVLSDDNRSLKDALAELQGRERAQDALRQHLNTEMGTRERQLKTLAAQNAELLRLLDGTEDKAGDSARDAARLAADNAELRGQLADAAGALRATEERTGVVAQEAGLRYDEVRLLQAEVDRCRSALAEAERRFGLETDSLAEALRVRKEKQYSLLEKAAAAEQAARKAADEVTQLQDALRGAHGRVQALEGQVASLDAAVHSQDSAVRAANEERVAAAARAAELQQRLEHVVTDRGRLESELRLSGEQLRAMAEKVFALLERLKLAELGKAKALEVVKTKDAEVAAAKKRADKMAKDTSKDFKARAALETTLRALDEEVSVSVRAPPPTHTHTPHTYSHTPPRPPRRPPLFPPMHPHWLLSFAGAA